MDYLSFTICLILTYLPIHLLITLLQKTRQPNRRKHPPGPPTIPILGNLLALGEKPHVSLTNLSKTYGPLMTLHLGRVTTIIISSSEVAKEVLQKNDISFSNRTVIDAVRAIEHHKNSLVWLPVSPQWRNLRKMCNTHVFSTARLDASQSIRKDKVRELLEFVEKCRADGVAVDIGQAGFDTSLNLLSSTFFSVDLVDRNSGIARDFKTMIRCIMNEAGKPNFGDYFPVLRRMDLQGIRRRMSVHFQKMVDLFNAMIEERLKGVDLKQRNDVLDALLGINQEKIGDIEADKIPYVLLDLFSAGTDTTSSTLEWAMAELLHNREKLKKAKSELNKIIGKGNLVEESHIGQLPYLQALVKETFRLHPAVPFLVPRKADTDVKVFGFTVPKDAQVLVNAWAIGRDPDIWEKPNSFEPERFMSSSVDVKGCDFELIPFGAGRRMCVGLPLAIRMIHLMLGSLIHGFDWDLEDGGLPADMNMEDRFAFTLEKAQPLRLIPVQV